MAKGDCPYCRQPGAVRVLWKVHCPNGACPKYDPALARLRAKNPARIRLGGDEASPRTGAGARPFMGLVLILVGIVVFIKMRGVTGLFLGGWLAVQGWKLMNAGKAAPEAEDTAEAPEVDEEGERADWERGTLDGYSEKRDESPLSVEDKLDRQDREQEEMQSGQERKRDSNDRESWR